MKTFIGTHMNCISMLIE